MNSFLSSHYVEKDDSYLMLHRTKKKGDINKDKWIGIGGHIEDGESPEDCILREAKEETGYDLSGLKFRGIVTFVYKDITEFMNLFTASGYHPADVQCGQPEERSGGLEGSLPECDEGELVWVKKADIPKLNLWEGDRIFFRLLKENEPFFSLKLVYSPEDVLLEAVLNGRKMDRI